MNAGSSPVRGAQDKFCVRCHQEKPLDEFNRYAKSKDGRQAHCRLCASAYYKSNKTKHLANVAARNKRYRVALARKIWAYLLEHPCVDCGEPDPIVLEFDHVRGVKTRSVSELITHSLPSWARIMEEIHKCDVRCRNCHKRRTAIQFGYYAWMEPTE